MYKNVIGLFLLLPLSCQAQLPKFDLGLSAPIFFRQSETYIDAYKHLFGAIGLEGTLRVNGTEENDMSFVLNAGFAEDLRKFDISVSSTVNTSLYFFDINPSVVIPSRWSNMQFCLGIGTLVRMGQRVSFSWGDPPAGGPYTTVDSVNNVINSNSRNFLPYISFGLSGDLGHHFRIEFTIRPTLLNLYEPGTTMNFSNFTGSTYTSTVLELNYQPIYAGIRLFYFIKTKGRG